MTLVVTHGIAYMDEVEYHAHPALSSSGARKLLPPSCPALFKWERDNGQQQRDNFDLGHAAHMLVLGAGAEVVSVDADDWRTKAAKEAKAAAHAEGKTPLLKADVARVEAMAAALRQHPIAAAVFDPEHGRPEQSLFWHDDRYDVHRRARLDWLPEDDANGRVIIGDYKTTVSAEPRAIAKHVLNYGYHQQAAWYIDGAHALDLGDSVGFLFVFQEKTPPYLTTVVELDDEALAVGRALNDRALEVFAECSATDTWPGYTTDIETVSLPQWAVRDFTQKEADAA